MPTPLTRSDQQPNETAQTLDNFGADDHPGAVLRRRGLVRPPPVLRGSAPMALLHPHHSNHLRSCMGLFFFSEPAAGSPRRRRPRGSGPPGRVPERSGGLPGNSILTIPIVATRGSQGGEAPLATAPAITRASNPREKQAAILAVPERRTLGLRECTSILTVPSVVTNSEAHCDGGHYHAVDAQGCNLVDMHPQRER